MESESAVELEVADTGIGIPAEERARLFERFFRASTAKERAIPGTGLGLAITKGLVEAHGGSIGVRSALGQGSTFWLRLPIERGQPLVEPAWIDPEELRLSA